MRFARLAATAAAVTLAIILAWTLRASSSPAPQLANRLGPTPVVVELFTSQGCSSCPPADAIVRELARDEHLRGHVIPLAFHVDYWNHLGWRDPFSSADWSRRQAFYVRQLALASAYTPQAVVNGSRDVVGNNGGALANAIVAASNEPSWGRLDATVTQTGDALHVKVTGDAAGARDLVVVVYENEATTTVAAGENGGRTLVNDRIVRQLTNAGSVNGKIDKMLTIPLASAWNAKNLGVVAFLQDHRTLAIRAAH